MSIEKIPIQRPVATLARVRGEQINLKQFIANLMLDTLQLQFPARPSAMNNLSQLEQLPNELFRSIVSYAPEKVPELRLSSRMLSFRVVEYALHHLDIPLVREVRILGTKGNLTKISILVPRKRLKLFELRLKRSTAPQNIFSRLKREKQPQLMYLNDCMGTHIKSVDVNAIDELELKVDWTSLSMLLEGKIIRLLKVEVATLTDDFGDNLLSFLKKHSIKQLMFELKEYETEQDKVNILLKISELVSTLQINQREVESLERRNNYFFGVFNPDLHANQNWDSVILNMLSKKLDKLCITNWNYAEYLQKESVENLIEKLPQLGKKKNKKVWLDVSCSNVPYVDDQTCYVHVVKARGYFLRIKHSSRVAEPLFI